MHTPYLSHQVPIASLRLILEQATESVFLSVALLTAIIRTAVRVHHFRRLYLDDYFLFFGVASLVVSQGLFFASVPVYYLSYLVTVGKVRPPLDLLDHAKRVTVFSIVAEVLAWTTIFAIKLSFLFYFRLLIERLPRLEKWWWFVFAMTVLTAGTNIPGSFIVCPYTGDQIWSHCILGPDFLYRERVGLIYNVVSDIFSDCLIISVPAILLRKARLQLRQKLSILVLLCLSVFMIAIAMIRGISIGVYGNTDQVWNSFWVQLETAIAVIAVSLMMFRSLFGIKPDRSTVRLAHDASDKGGWRGLALRFLRRLESWVAIDSAHNTSSSSLNRSWLGRRRTPQLPSLHAGATMTGMRSMIRDNGRTVAEGSVGGHEGQKDSWENEYHGQASVKSVV